MATAGFFGPVMTKLTGNTSGNVESLPLVTNNGGRQRVAGDQIVCAAQAAGSIISVARIPVGSMILGVRITTSVTLATATLSVGDVNNGAAYAAAATYTAVNATASVGNATALMTPIASGYDSATGLVSNSYEDIVLTVGTAALPASGVIAVAVEYALD